VRLAHTPQIREIASRWVDKLTREPLAHLGLPTPSPFMMGARFCLIISYREITNQLRGALRPALHSMNGSVVSCFHPAYISPVLSTLREQGLTELLASIAFVTPPFAMPMVVELPRR
jgi:hypothetical protein